MLDCFLREQLHGEHPCLADPSFASAGCGLGVRSDWKDRNWKNKNRAAPRLCAGQAC